MKRQLFSTLLAIFFLCLSATTVRAQTGSVLGIHILHPDEITDAQELLRTDAELFIDETQSHELDWQYVTVPLSFNQLQDHDQWQAFFDRAREAKLQPIVRMVTYFDDGSWQVPNKREIVAWYEFLGKLDWPRDDKLIIILNEPNHLPEFGGSIEPETYAEVLEFAALWAHSENNNYKVLPAALDLAAPNGPVTMEAFTYLDRMIAHRPQVFEYISAWNSHSYANPGFSSSPLKTDKSSLRGFQHELDYIKEKTGRDLEVYITETGWVENASTKYRLNEYYQYAFDNIWSDPRVKAVTPFILRGDPGPFSGFTFLDKNGYPTRQYLAYRALVERENVSETSESVTE